MTEISQMISMPAAIIRALIKVKQDIGAAKQTGQNSEDGESFSYATADDVFAAVQGPLAKAGFLVEMLDDGLEFVPIPGAESNTLLVHMRFIPVIHFAPTDEAVPISYENARAIVHMIGTYEGMKTCGSLRTMAEKTYLRSLLKLPTTKAEKADEQAVEAGVSQYVGGPSAQSEAEGPQVGGRGRAKIVQPFVMDTDASGDMRDTIIAEMDAASKKDTDAAGRIGAINAAFKKRQTEFTRLTTADQSKVKKRNGELMNAAAKPAKVEA